MQICVSIHFPEKDCFQSPVALPFNRLLKNKNQVVRQGARRLVKRSPARGGGYEALARAVQRCMTASGGPQAQFLNSLLNSPAVDRLFSLPDFLMGKIRQNQHLFY